LNETSISQQNTTTYLSPAGGGVRRTGVDYSQSTKNTPELQQNTTTVDLPEDYHIVKPFSKPAT